MFFVEIYKKNFFAIVSVVLISGFFQIEMVYAKPGACAAQVQGKIAWDYKGSKRWRQDNIDRLCRGAERSTEPARCFNKVMHGGVNWGGGTRWQWKNAIDLCESSTNADATIGCFQRKIKKGKSWKAAIKTCGRAVNVKPASSPLKGFVDLHTHPMSHLGFGRKAMHGAPDINIIVPASTSLGCGSRQTRARNMLEALGNCNATHGGWGIDNTCGDYIRAAIINNALDDQFQHITLLDLRKIYTTTTSTKVIRISPIGRIIAAFYISRCGGSG